MTTINLGSLTTKQGFKIIGAASNDYSGRSVSEAGDVNGDGYADFIIGARGAYTNTGISYIIYGTTNFVDINLSSLNSTQGFSITGAVVGDYSGHSASSLGDINGDGYADFIIGAPQCLSSTSCTKSGISYAIFGGNNLVDINLANLNSSQGFSITGASAVDYSGWSVSAAGDVNGDGYKDILIGTPRGLVGDPSPKKGIAYVIFGKAVGFVNINLANDLTTTSQGFSITGQVSYDYNGFSVSGAGDMNKDGYSEIVIGAYGADNGGTDAGEVFVIYGKANGFTNIDLNSFTSTQGFMIIRKVQYDQLGYSVAAAGDVNGDGYSDIIIGAPGRDISGAGTDVGINYIIFGKSTFPAVLDLSASFTLDEGFYVVGDNGYDRTGTSVHGAGDLNGDGYDDIIIGAPTNVNSNSNEAGTSYVIFGKRNATSYSLYSQTLTEDQGFYITGSIANGYSGYSVSEAGDINGDGYDDIIVGAYGTSSNTGTSYVIFGAPYYTDSPTSSPTTKPTLTPTNIPSFKPTPVPSVKPSTFKPSVKPTTLTPTVKPTLDPTNKPTASPTLDPTQKPTMPTALPTIVPSAPTVSPTLKPSVKPTFSPTIKPTAKPTFLPTLSPNTPVNTLSDIDLAYLNSNQGFRINGEVSYDNSGFSVSGIGDFNGDGLDDIIIGAPYADPNIDSTNRYSAGVSYVVFGKTAGFADVELTDLTATQRGFKILGEATSDNSGLCVSGAGDVNGDGYDDVIIGAPYADPNGKSNAGVSYVIFGKAIGFTDIDLTSLTSTQQGFRVIGSSRDSIAFSVSGAGDMNGDGYADVIIGNGSQDISYVIFGKASGFSDIDLYTFTSGASGFKILGEAADDYSGCAVSDAGDVNGDGYADVIIGAYLADPKNRNDAGASYVVFGKADVFEDINLYSVTSKQQGFKILGANTGNNNGISVSNAGDVNGDGYDDVIIGTFATDISYIIFGKASGFTDIDLATFTTTQGFKILGDISSDYQNGFSVSGAGDVNGDGYADVIVGACNIRSYAGGSYVIFGKANNFEDIDIATLTITQGFRIYGSSYDRWSHSLVSGAGDINEDGYDDVIIGAYLASPNGKTSAGSSYVIFGANNIVVTPTFSPAPQYIDVYITSGGSYTGTSAAENFIVDAAADTTITGNGGADMFTIKENMNVETTITDFNEINEILNLEDFKEINSVSELVYSSVNPTIISFDNNQNLILEGVTSSELTSNNFVFYEYDGGDGVQPHQIQSLIITSVAAIVGTCFLCCSVYGAYRFAKYLWPVNAEKNFAGNGIEITIENPLPSETLSGVVEKGDDFHA